MIEIKDLLGKFSKLLVSGEVKKGAIRDVLQKTIGIDIKSEDIKIKNNTIYLNIRPIYKNEIFLKQEKIFLALKESLGEKIPKDIR
ncbi:MAG: hypothetical protein P4L63_02700 [Candidatus Pacebacteria bacterium]|nr:hypothetical protein [Candidatus Paceibacterota bacterium]